MQILTGIINGSFSGILEGAWGLFSGYLLYFSRYLLPVVALVLLMRCAISMLRERYEPEVWAYMVLPSGARVPLRNWECTVGRGSCDVKLRYPGIASPHLALIRDEGGNWRVYDLVGSGSRVNGHAIGDNGARLMDGDEIALGRLTLSFVNLNKMEREEITHIRTAPGRRTSAGSMFGCLSIFQLLLLYQHLCTSTPEERSMICLAFLAMIALTWTYYIVMTIVGRRGLEVEVLALFLSSIGLSATASCEPESLLKVLLLTIAGVVAFLLLGLWLRDLKRTKGLRFPAALVACALLALTFLIGEERYGARNWIALGNYTIQPSEFVKLAYIYAGSSALDKIYRKRSLMLFIVFSAVCVGALAIMGDFGTALVFFGSFLVISFLRSGNLATVLLALTGAGLAGFLTISAKPYIAERFALWGNAWQDINGSGYQQTRGMSAAASGGLFGVGAGGGWLNTVVASETDLVFELVCEELGVITGVCAVLALVVLAVFVVRNIAQARSAFYVIAGVGAVSMMLIQAALNVFGSLDMLPFTGVTLPFISLGGSSLVSCWAMLAFIKATDTRKDSSFAVRSPSKLRDKNEFDRGVYSRDRFYPDNMEERPPAEPFERYCDMEGGRE